MTGLAFVVGPAVWRAGYAKIVLVYFVSLEVYNLYFIDRFTTKNDNFGYKYSYNPCTSLSLSQIQVPGDCNKDVAVSFGENIYYPGGGGGGLNLVS